MRAASLLPLVLVAACAAPSAHLAGRVVRDGDPVPHAVVTARPAGGGEELRAVTDGEGIYRFPPLPPAAYRLGGRDDSASAYGLIAGKTPVHLAPGTSAWVGLQAVPLDLPEFRPVTRPVTGFGDLAGRVRYRDAPVGGAIVYLYLDDLQDFKGPGFRQSFPTHTDGTFFLSEVPEGRYFLAARKRRSGSPSGPIREGDLHGLALANPVPIRSGTETVLDLHLVRKERDDDPGADLLARTGTGIQGRVVDSAGNPVGGVYVFAYRNRIIGHGMPDFLTLPTGEDGSFALALGDGGLFYVGAREHFGGSPQPGEHFGFYEGSADHGIQVPKGRIVGDVEIRVRKVLGP